MGEGKLKTAVLGLDGGGQLLLRAASEVDYFKIEAVADRDVALAEKFATEYDCVFYDDYRQLIMQNQLDCLLVAAGMYSCEKQIRIAMKKKFNVLKLAPAARDFEEAAEFVSLAEEENINFAVANPGRFAQSFLAFRRYLQQGLLEQAFLIRAFCNIGGPVHPNHKHYKEGSGARHSWQTDPKLAGGGVLLRDCYELIDQIVVNFGLPQQVYSLNTNEAQDKQQRLYLTEDTAVVTMKFSDKLIGNLIASRRGGMGPEQEFLKVYGRDKTLTINSSEFVVSDGMGQTEQRLKYEDDEFCWMTKQLRNFAVSILWPDENKLCSSGKENLRNMAVIESAYLSARTAMPEEPGRIVRIAPHSCGTATDV